MESRGGQGPSDMLKDELTQSLEELEALLKAKDEVKVMRQAALWRHFSQRRIYPRYQVSYQVSPTLELCVFQEIRILQAKKSNFHEMEQEREEAIHRLQVQKKEPL